MDTKQNVDYWKITGTIIYLVIVIIGFTFFQDQIETQWNVFVNMIQNQYDMIHNVVQAIVNQI